MIEFFYEHYDELKDTVRQQLIYFFANLAQPLYKQARDNPDFSFQDLLSGQKACMVLADRYACVFASLKEPVVHLPEYQEFAQRFQEDRFLKPYWERCLKGIPVFL